MNFENVEFHCLLIKSIPNPIRTKLPALGKLLRGDYEAIHFTIIASLNFLK
jgi:hypothetical protein